MDLIVIHGAPGCGKTTIARLLHEHYKSPWFEFGWIPEFTHKNSHTDISSVDEENMTFESLMLVVQNYIRHGFSNILLSDLNDCRLLDIIYKFHNQPHVIITLYSEHPEIIKERILTRDNGNEYRDYESAIKLNHDICTRPTLPNEYRICSDELSPADIVTKVVKLIDAHTSNNTINTGLYRRSDYYSYTKRAADFWYHGSPIELTELRTGSTITRWRELAEAFSHKPEQLSYDTVGGRIKYNGQIDGFLYLIDEPLIEDTDIYKHTNTSMDNGVEWLTKRPLKLKLIGSVYVSNNILCRKANINDLEKIIQIDHLKRYEQIYNAVFQDECCVAEEGAQIVGFSIMDYSFFCCGFIELLIVKEQHRRRGIGAALMDYLYQQCKTEKLFTSTNVSNAPMRGLLAKSGFIPCGQIDALDEGDPELFFVRKKKVK